MDSFASLVRVSLSEWPTLQLAIEQGMGGPQAKEKEEWMSTVLIEFFTNEIGSSVQELSEYIEEIMDNEFDTVIDDSSSDLLATRLLRFYQMMKNGQVEQVNEILKLKTEQLEEKRRKNEAVPKLINVPVSQPSPGESAQGTSSQTQEMDVDDGWTVVNNKKGKRKSEV